MKNTKNNVKAIITTKIKKQLPLVATASVLAISSLSVQAQLSIYGGTSTETVTDSQQSYNNYASSNNYYSNKTPTYPNYPTTYQNNSYTQNSSYNSYNPYSRNSYNNSYNQSNQLDKLGGLIEQKASEYQYHSSILDTARSNAQTVVYQDLYEASSFDKTSNNYTTASFEAWQNKYGNRLKVKAYRQYLEQYLGANNVPPMSQLLQTAKSWRKCGAEPYSVPPFYYWHNMVPTLRLFNTLKSQGIIPRDTQINSVYRTSRLNRCAGGANGSKHKINSALDLSSPSIKFTSYKRRQVQNDMCNFWLYQGRYYSFGLGLYKNGSIHIDTSKYRKWGNNYSSNTSPCRSPSFF
ncbi:MAG: peptidase M15A [Moraxellaceae bacterium]|nr:peptidase M15A [Moraxellaceae bacterium]